MRLTEPFTTAAATALLATATTVLAGPAAYGICQAGCAAIVVACYTAGGFTFGTVTGGAGAPAVVLGCNLAFGTCQSKCSVAFFFFAA